MKHLSKFLYLFFGALLLLVGATFVIQQAAAAPSGSTPRPDHPESARRAAAPAQGTPTATPTASCVSGWVVSLAAPPDNQYRVLHGMAARAANDVWSVGSRGLVTTTHEATLIEHWDGTAWSLVPSPNPSQVGDNSLFAVTALTANDAWAAGRYYPQLNQNPEQPLMLHWDGLTWSPVPNPALIASGFLGLAAVTPNDIWTVGYGNYGDSPLAEHWNGTQWLTTTVPLPPAAQYGTLSSISARTSSDIWAVGAVDVPLGTGQTLIEHWNGSAWSVVPSPNRPGDTDYLSGVTALAANDVWAVGTWGSSTQTLQTLVMHWDGTQWSIISSPSPTSSTLHSVAARSGADVWAVGSQDGSAATLIEHWDGSAWNIETSPGVGINNVYLYGVAVAPDALWASGSYGNQALIERYDLACLPTATLTPISTATSTPFPTATASGPTNTSTPSATQTPVPQPTVYVCGPLADVPPGYPDEAAIGCVTCRGVMSAYSCGGVGEPCLPNNAPYFRPAQGWDGRRGEFAKLLVKAAAWPIQTPSSQTYEDVPPSNPYYPYVETATAHGQLPGYICGGPGEPCVAPSNRSYFRPLSLVNRGIMAKTFAESAGFTDVIPMGQQTFEDINNNHPFWLWVERLAVHGVTAGYPCGGPGEPCNPPNNRPYFRPGTNLDQVRRDEMAELVDRTFFPQCVIGATMTPTATATPTVTATTTPTATATTTPCAIQFADVPVGSTFYTFIRCLACRGIVGGYACGGPGEPCPGPYYRPNNPVTRGQVAKIVAESAGFNEVILSPQQTFEDVAPGTTFWLWIERLAGRGIIGGYPCGGPFEPCIAPTNRPYFRPNNPVTRGQLSKIVASGAGWTETPTGQTFEDVPPASPFYLYVERLVSHGNIVGGYPCGGPFEPCVPPGNRPYFRPNNNTTRGQMSKLATQVFFPNCQTPARR